MNKMKVLQKVELVQLKLAHKISNFNLLICIMFVYVYSMMANIYHWKIRESSEKIYECGL